MWIKTLVDEKFIRTSSRNGSVTGSVSVGSRALESCRAAGLPPPNFYMRMCFAGSEYEIQVDSLAIFSPDGNVLFMLTSEMDIKITISVILNELNLTALPVAFATQAIRMASDPDVPRRVEDLCRRCANVALTGCCWVELETDPFASASPPARGEDPWPEPFLGATDRPRPLAL